MLMRFANSRPCEVRPQRKILHICTPHASKSKMPSIHNLGAVSHLPAGILLPRGILQLTSSRLRANFNPGRAPASSSAFVRAPAAFRTAHPPVNPFPFVLTTCRTSPTWPSRPRTATSMSTSEPRLLVLPPPDPFYPEHVVSPRLSPVPHLAATRAPRGSLSSRTPRTTPPVSGQTGGWGAPPRA